MCELFLMFDTIHSNNLGKENCLTDGNALPPLVWKIKNLTPFYDFCQLERVN